MRFNRILEASTDLQAVDPIVTAQTLYALARANATNNITENEALLLPIRISHSNILNNFRLEFGFDFEPVVC